jgi:hypothetical protein
VEVSDPVVPFLRRLEEKGVIETGFWSTLPRDEAEVAQALSEALLSRDKLNAWDRRRLEGYLDQFDPDRRKKRTKLRYQDSSFAVEGSVEYHTGIYGRDSIPRADVFAFGSLSPAFALTYRKWGYLASKATVGMERNLHKRYANENFLPQNGLPYNIERNDAGQAVGKVSTFDGLRMVAGVGTDDLRIEAGQDWNEWGPGRWQHATLGARPYFWVSDSLAPNPNTGFEGTRQPSGGYRRGYRYPGEGPPMPQLRLRFKSDHWEYVKIVSQRTGLWKDSAATLIAHRLQLRAGSWRLGLTEMLTIGSRSNGWLSLLPGVPLRVIEHEGGNRDNAAMSGDVEWIWRGVGRLYGEIFLDDFSGFPLDYWGNKFAWTFGGSWQDPLGVPAELHLEYSRVDPWVYNHHLTGTQMQNYGALLGSSLPPNAHALSASATFPAPFQATGSLEWQLRQRDLKSPGGSIFEDRPLDPDARREFLKLDVETRNQIGGALDWSWDRRVQLRAGAGGLWVSNFRGDPGRSLVTPTAFAELWLRY